MTLYSGRCRDDSRRAMESRRGVDAVPEGFRAGRLGRPVRRNTVVRVGGVTGLLDLAKSSATIRADVRQYGLWLSKTFDRTGDAIAVLGKVREIAPDAELDGALAEARLKNRVLEGKGSRRRLLRRNDRPPSPPPWPPASSRLQAETRNIDFGAFSNLSTYSEGPRIRRAVRVPQMLGRRRVDRRARSRTPWSRVAADPDPLPMTTTIQDSIGSIAADENPYLCLDRVSLRG